MSARSTRKDIGNFSSFVNSVNTGIFDFRDKAALRYEMGNYLTGKLHNDARTRYLLADFCANLYNSITTKLRAKILNSFFNITTSFTYDKTLFAGGTFLTDQQKQKFESDTLLPFKYQESYDNLIDHVFGLYSKGGTNPNYHLAKYNIENQIPTTFEEERRVVGPLTDYDFILIVNPFLPPDVRNLIVLTVNEFFRTEIPGIINDTLTNHPFGEADLGFTVEDFVKETLLVAGEGLGSYTKQYVTRKLNSGRIEYTEQGGLKRIFIQPFDIEGTLKQSFNPIAELFDFDCYFDYSNTTFSTPNLGCYSQGDLMIKYWRHWIECRRNPVTSYTEYLLKQKPLNEFEGLYLQTLEICLEDLNNTIERTKTVDNVKLEKRMKRKKIIEELLFGSSSAEPMDVDTVEACPVPETIIKDGYAIAERIRDHFVSIVNSRTIRTVNAFSPKATLTIIGNYLPDPNFIIGAFETLYDNGYRLDVTNGNVEWVASPDGSQLRVRFNGKVTRIDGLPGGQFQADFVLNSLGGSNGWEIHAGDFIVG